VNVLQEKLDAIKHDPYQAQISGNSNTFDLQRKIDQYNHRFACFWSDGEVGACETDRPDTEEYDLNYSAGVIDCAHHMLSDVVNT